MNATKSEQTAVDEIEVELQAGDERQFLTFLLAGETYGIDIRHIKEITEYATITQVPMMPEFIAGVTNLRGNVVPVIDLAVRFSGAPVEPGKRTSIIIIELPNGESLIQIGIIVDEVSEVLELTSSEIEPPPTFGARIRTDFISGMGRVNGLFLVLLDVEHVLSIDELSEIQSMSEHEKTT